jgi:hypothetical protein
MMPQRPSLRRTILHRSLTLAIGLAAAGSSIAACNDDKGGASGEFCTLAKVYDGRGSEFADAMDTGDAALLEAAVQKAGGQLDKMTGAAPSQLEADVSLLNTTYQEFIAALEAVDYDMVALSTSADAAVVIDKLDSPEVNAASLKLDDYLAKTCGIKTES